MQAPILRTPRTLMTMLAVDQAALLLDYHQTNIQHLAPWEPARDADFFTLATMQERIAMAQESFNLGNGIAWAVLTPDGNQMIATCNFANIVRGFFQACFMGYSVSHAHQGQGLMFEAAQAGIGHMFGTMGLHRIMANHLVANQRSAHLLARLGFEREGYAKAYLKINGQWQDHVLNALVNPAM